MKSKEEIERIAKLMKRFSVSSNLSKKHGQMAMHFSDCLEWVLERPNPPTQKMMDGLSNLAMLEESSPKN